MRLRDKSRYNVIVSDLFFFLWLHVYETHDGNIGETLSGFRLNLKLQYDCLYIPIKFI